MRTLALAIVPFAAMLIGCQISPLPTETQQTAATEPPPATQTAVPRFGPFSPGNSGS